jgi:hypothetical protein
VKNIPNQAPDNNRRKLKLEIDKLSKMGMSTSRIVSTLQILADIKSTVCYELITGYTEPTAEQLTRIQKVVEMLKEDTDKSGEINAFIYDLLEKHKQQEGKK